MHADAATAPDDLSTHRAPVLLRFNFSPSPDSRFPHSVWIGVHWKFSEDHTRRAKGSEKTPAGTLSMDDGGFKDTTTVLSGA